MSLMSCLASSRSSSTSSASRARMRRHAPGGAARPLGVARLLGGGRRLHHSREVGQELGPVVYLGEFGAVRRIDSIAAIRAERAGCVPGAFAMLGWSLPRDRTCRAPAVPGLAPGSRYLRRALSGLPMVRRGRVQGNGGSSAVLRLPQSRSNPGDGAPGRIRTCDLPLRRRLLCPLSYGDGPSGMMRLRAPRVQGNAPLPVRGQTNVSAPAAPRRPNGRPTPWPVRRSRRGSPDR